MTSSPLVTTPTSATPLRSPPPKRSRDDDAVNGIPLVDDGMNIDQHSDSSAGIQDITFDEAEDENQEAANGFFDDESAASNSCTDLNDRFADTETDDGGDVAPSTPETEHHHGDLSSRTPGDPMAMMITPPSNTTPNTMQASLNSQYTTDMGSAGAADP
jgi:hypothetical protein